MSLDTRLLGVSVISDHKIIQVIKQRLGFFRKKKQYLSKRRFNKKNGMRSVMQSGRVVSIKEIKHFNGNCCMSAQWEATY